MSKKTTTIEMPHKYIVYFQILLPMDKVKESEEGFQGLKNLASQFASEFNYEIKDMGEFEKTLRESGRVAVSKPYIRSIAEMKIPQQNLKLMLMLCPAKLTLVRDDMTDASGEDKPNIGLFLFGGE